MDECQLEKPVIVCLCGSTRFGEMFRYVNQRETLAGKIVLAPGCFQGDAVLEVLPRVKQQLDELHLHKIALADEILVVNVGGYIGQSTRREIAYARQQGKWVRWLESGACGDEDRE
jgi:NifB/MoaA-like Fe-S oxidoreductase